MRSLINVETGCVRIRGTSHAVQEVCTHEFLSLVTKCVVRARSNCSPMTIFHVLGIRTNHVGRPERVLPSVETFRNHLRATSDACYDRGAPAIASYLRFPQFRSLRPLHTKETDLKQKTPPDKNGLRVGTRRKSCKAKWHISDFLGLRSSGHSESFPTFKRAA